MFRSEFYGGSLMLAPLAETIGLPIDQINFLFCQLIALSLAFPFRSQLCVDKVGVRTRHIIETTIGLLLTIFCFGSQLWHLLAQSIVSYLCMVFGGKSFSHALVFVFSMGYLSVCHIYRQIYDYGGYTLDITGPLMIQTQKLTSLAFALHDGRYKDEKELSHDQKSQAVKKLPDLLEYLSYMFYFHGIMVGPLTFFNDYIAFIEEKDVTNKSEQSSMKHPTADLNKLVVKKLLVATACCLGMMLLPGLFFNPEKLNSPDFYSWSFAYKVLFILGAMTIAKQKYYFAWKLADAVNNAAGFGFSGYDQHGSPQWDLTDNVDIWGVEMSTSLKVNIDSWNKKTLLWLRRLVYDRAPMQKTLSVFTCSAFWHGFYPGYYVTFGTGALMTVVARQVRRNIRPWFQRSVYSRLIYDCITFIATRLANSYICFPFLILEFYSCLTMYKSIYFFYHVLTLASYLCFYVMTSSRSRPNPTVFNRGQLQTADQSQLQTGTAKENSDSNLPQDPIKQD
nr:membrane-bound O-acyltransferase domain-containing protein 2 [Biomphalaria glabrata]